MGEPSRQPPLVLATEAGEARGVAACAAAVAASAATGGDDGRPAPVVVAETGARSPRGPTMLASAAARGVERSLMAAGLRGAARGQVCWLSLGDGSEGLDGLETALEPLAGARLVIATLAPALWGEAIARPGLHPGGALLRCELPARRSLAALATMELRERGLVVRIDRHGFGPLASRRALAGLDPGGATGRRARRMAAAFLGAARSRAPRIA